MQGVPCNAMHTSGRGRLAKPPLQQPIGWQTRRKCLMLQLNCICHSCSSLQCRAHDISDPCDGLETARNMLYSCDNSKCICWQSAGCLRDAACLGYLIMTKLSGARCRDVICQTSCWKMLVVHFNVNRLKGWIGGSVCRKCGCCCSFDVIDCMHIVTCVWCW
jgi:hypothetical protein